MGYDTSFRTHSKLMDFSTGKIKIGFRGWRLQLSSKYQNCILKYQIKEKYGKGYKNIDKIKEKIKIGSYVLTDSGKLIQVTKIELDCNYKILKSKKMCNDVIVFGIEQKSFKQLGFHYYGFIHNGKVFTDSKEIEFAKKIYSSVGKRPYDGCYYTFDFLKNYKITEYGYMFLRYIQDNYYPYIVDYCKNNPEDIFGQEYLTELTKLINKYL